MKKRKRKLPQYRVVEYRYDGHTEFQCLNCKKFIDAGDEFEPKYCPECGIKFKSMQIKHPKLIEVIPCPDPKLTRTTFLIQIRTRWHDDPWDDWEPVHWMGTHYAPTKALQWLRHYREEYDKNEDDCNSIIQKEYRIILGSEPIQRNYIKIRVDKFYHRVGYHFDKKKYETGS